MRDLHHKQPMQLKNLSRSVPTSRISDLALQAHIKRVDLPRSCARVVVDREHITVPLLSHFAQGLQPDTLSMAIGPSPRI